MLKIELNEKDFSNFMETLPMMRFDDVKALISYIRNGTNIKLEIKEVAPDDTDLDNRLISNVTVNNTDLCYLDIYYLKDNGGRLYITEVGTDFSI